MQRKVTIKDIAELAKTSKTTVSFYLNGRFDKMSEETKNRIKSTIEATNYKPSIAARSLNAKSTKLIGVVIGDITNSFQTKLSKELKAKPRNLVTKLSSETATTTLLAKMNSLKRCSILVLMVLLFNQLLTLENIHVLSILKKERLSFLYSQLYEHRTNWVKTNNYDAVYDTIQQCIDKGYEHFIMITGNPNLLSTRIERASGFIDVLEANHLTHQEMIID